MKRLAPIFCLLSCLLLLLFVGHAGPIRGGFGGTRPSYGGFRSSSLPTYRSYSASPSRSFTFSRSAASTPRPVAPASRPAATTPTPTGRRSASPASVRQPVVNNHFHQGGASGGGGMSLVDYLVLHELVAGSSHSAPDAGALAAAAGGHRGYDIGQPSASVVEQEDDGTDWLEVLRTVVRVGSVLYGIYLLGRWAKRRLLGRPSIGTLRERARSPWRRVLSALSWLLILGGCVDLITLIW